MSDYEVKEGDIALFVNDKEGNEKRPDLTGYAIIGGKKKDVSVWAKDSGRLRFSGKVQEPYNSGGSDRKTSQTSTEVPF
tara:strand:- start:489 stop:725 length:237 start_codon:yes stop_codon:yes gene_type:complete